MPKQIKQTYQIAATAETVFKALTDKKLIEEWSGDSASMDVKVGTKFKLWSGSVFGENIKVVPNKLLQQTWFSDNKAWQDFRKSGQVSTVTFDLSEKDGQTILKLTHDNVPEADYKNTDDGWREYYLGPLKELVESS